MKSAFTFFLVVLSNQLWADYEYGVIYKSDGDSIECLIDVYESGALVGNTERLYYRVNQDNLSLSLDQVSMVQINDNSYHVLTLKEQGEHFFDEEAILEQKVLARLIQEGEVKLYQYHYSGNSIYSNGKPNKALGKSLHERPIIKNKDETTVVYKMTFASIIKRFFPNQGKEILSSGLGYNEIGDAVIEGNKYLANN